MVYSQKQRLSRLPLEKAIQRGAFVLDFYCPDSRLAVELDGQVHTRLGARERDFARTEFLRRAGIKVVRFENWRIFDDWENVEKEILQGLTGKS